MCIRDKHKIAKSLDRGDILAQRKYDIQPGNDSVDIYLKSGRQALSMVKELMEDFDRVWSCLLYTSFNSLVVKI